MNLRGLRAPCHPRPAQGTRTLTPKACAPSLSPLFTAPHCSPPLPGCWACKPSARATSLTDLRPPGPVQFPDRANPHPGPGHSSTGAVQLAKDTGLGEAWLGPEVLPWDSEDKGEVTGYSHPQGNLFLVHHGPRVDRSGPWRETRPGAELISRRLAEPGSPVWDTEGKWVGSGAW